MPTPMTASRDPASARRSNDRPAAGAPHPRAATRVVWLALLAAGCAAPAGRLTTRTTFERTPHTSVDSIMAPVRGDGLAELAALQRLPPSAANELRRAYVLSESGDFAGAIATLNRLLYGEEPPTAVVESLARYLRARASRQRGDQEEIAADLARARELTDDPQLLALIDAASPKPRAPEPAVPEARTPAAPAALTVLPRSAWGARPLRQADLQPMTKPYRITIHHTAILATSTSERVAAAQIYQIQADHQHSAGWADIGYHYLIDPAGRIWEGRPIRYQGAHAGGDNNRGNIGVCLLGRFLRGRDGQAPTPEQAATLDRLLRQLCREHGIGPGNIHFHRRYKATDCPGPRLEAVVNEIRRRMERAAQS